MIAGLEAIGTRETNLIETATIGNEAPILEKREFWYSPRLGVNLITKRQEPRFSTQQNFEVTNIALGEPDAKLFDPPSGFRILDLRKPARDSFRGVVVAKLIFPTNKRFPLELLHIATDL